MARLWFYLSALIVISAMVSYLSWHNTRLSNQNAAIEQAGLDSRRSSLDNYLDKQTDGHKLISLAKRYQKTEPGLIEPIAVKAYELLPNSRDAALLASAYRPELIEKVKELDPLY